MGLEAQLNDPGGSVEVAASQQLNGPTALLNEPKVQLNVPAGRWKVERFSICIANIQLGEAHSTEPQGSFNICAANIQLDEVRFNVPQGHSTSQRYMG